MLEVVKNQQQILSAQVVAYALEGRPPTALRDSEGTDDGPGDQVMVTGRGEFNEGDPVPERERRRGEGEGPGP